MFAHYVSLYVNANLPHAAGEALGRRLPVVDVVERFRKDVSQAEGGEGCL